MKLFDAFIKQLKPQKAESELDVLQKRIGYRFGAVSVLKAALLHPSAHNNGKDIPPFERMEFLGDAVLGLLTSEELFLDYPNYQEGELTKLKSKLVSRKYLAHKAKEFELGKFITMSKEAEMNGGRKSVSIVGNTMESLICAIYLDGTIEDVRTFIKRFILNDINSITKIDKLINYKSKLQEYFQTKSPQLPDYILVKSEGPDHQRIFTVKVFINNEFLGEGTGKTKKEAEQSAAKKALQKVKS